MRKLILSAVLIASALVNRQALGQQTKTTDCLADRVACAYDSALGGLVDTVKRPATTDDEKKKHVEDIGFRLDELLDPVRTPDHFVLALSSFSDIFFNTAFNTWQQSRVDKQIGSNAAGKGTTDLVSRPSTSDLLGLAMQLGALTETVSGSVATFQANADGAYRAITGQPIVCQDCLPGLSLKNLDFFFAFDLSSQSTKTLATSGPATSSTPPVPNVVLPQSSRQFSSLTVRYQIKNPLDPRSKAFQQGWAKAYKNHFSELEAEAKVLNSALIPILQPLSDDADGRVGQLQDPCTAAGEPCNYRQKILDDATAAAADAKAFDQLNKDFRNYLSELSKIARADIPDLDQQLNQAVAAYAQYSQINYDTVMEARGSQFTAEYSFNRPQNQPETHDFRLIVGLNPKLATSGSLFTLNFAGSLYGSQIPAGSNYGRLRNFQFATQFDRPLGGLLSHPATLSLAGYVQYQFDPSVLNIGPGNLAPGTNITLPQDAQVLLGTKGTLGVLQAKITINTKSGVNIPIGISWANKTDLINATDVRGHVGITYDFNSFSQLLGVR